MSSTQPDHLIRHGLLLMAATQVANIANLLFHIAMGRLLVGETAAEYGVLVAMLSAILILGTPLSALSTSATFFTAILKKENQEAIIRKLLLLWSKKLSIFAISLFIGGLLALPFLKKFFHINLSSVIIVSLAAMAFSFFPPILIGIFQGLQMFLLASIIGNLWTIVRLILGIILILVFGKNAFYPLLAQTTGIVLSLILGYTLLIKILPKENNITYSAIKEPENIPSYFFLSFITLAAFSFLMNGDMLLVKHFFPPEKAGTYAQISTIARTIIFLPMPIAGALFPKVVSEKTVTHYDVKLLIKAIIFAVLIVIFAALVASLLPWLPLKIIYPATEPTPTILKAIRCAVWAMAPLALIFILMNFELAQKRFIITIILISAGLIFGISTALRHSSIFNVITFLALASSTALIATIATIIIEHRKQNL